MQATKTWICGGVLVVFAAGFILLNSPRRVAAEPEQTVTKIEKTADRVAGAIKAADENGPVNGPVPANNPLATKDISLNQANLAVAAAIKKSQELGIKEDIAIVDAGGNLKAFNRMDGAWLGSIDISIKKARTSRYFDMPTGKIGELSQPGKPLYQIEVSNGGLITFPGGVPLKAGDGTVIGAVGASGSTVENDHAVAEAAAAALSGK